MILLVIIGGDCMILNNDELKLYRGEDYIITDYIRIHQPTLNEICDYGEKEYFSMVHTLTATPQNLKFQLWDMGIDYTEITPYELFYSILYKMFSQEQTSILFGDLDLTKFEVFQNKKSGLVFMKQEDIIIDEYVYNLIMNYLRGVHNIKKDEWMPMNNSTKMMLIEDDREAYLINKEKEHHSQLKNLISTMINSEGFKYNHSQVWEMKINAFMDSVKRLSHIKNADLLLQSGYSGFGISFKDIKNKKQLDYFGEL